MHILPVRQRANVCQRTSFNISCDEHVFIYSGSAIERPARIILVALITFLLLAPVLICNGIDNATARVIVIILSTLLLQVIVSNLTKSRTIELFICGVT
jgi:hypothetical protein